MSTAKISQCKIAGCKGKVRTLGMCATHYARHWRHGGMDANTDRRHKVGYEASGYKHGHTSQGGVTNYSPEYRTWGAIKQRTTNPRHPAYARYGGAGVSMWPEWVESFDAFLAFIGPRPEPKCNYSIDRFPNKKGNYEPGNVRWATRRQQNRNRQTNHLITHNGETRTIVEWAEIKGLPATLLAHRLAAGWDVEDALTRPVRRQKHRGGQP
jgi:hypothetical protein